MSVTSQAEKARQSALKLQGYSTDDKNKVLSAIAEGISAYKDFIISENKKDLDIFPDKTSALFDRLLLNEKRVMQMVEGVRAVIDLKDPVGEVTAEWDRPSGLHIKKVRAPLGDYLRSPSQRYRRCRRTLHKKRQRGDTSRKQTGVEQQSRDL